MSSMLCSSMDPAATTVATSLASSVVADVAALVVATARSMEHGDGRSGRRRTTTVEVPLH